MSTNDKPTVLIVGAGLGGLMLGALLEKQSVPYTIFERAATIKPLGKLYCPGALTAIKITDAYYKTGGSALSVGPVLLPIFEQLGIYDEFVSIAKFSTQLNAFNESLKPHRPHDYTPLKELAGYGQYIVARPILHELFLKQIPPHKIHFGHRVLNITEEDNKAIIHLSNNQTFEGDIVVGADGAYSAVRQRMYEKLKAKGELPKSDEEDLPFSCTCLVGQTKVLDPKEYPIVKEPHAQFYVVLGEDKPYTWITFTTAQNTLCFMVIHHLSKTTSKGALEQRFRNNENSEWGAHPAQTMCDETRDFRIPARVGMKTMGDIYDLTPKDLISKVMLEEKVFKTWHSGRSVLLGDACHKLNPSGGHGAVTAIHDAIALANLLYALPSNTTSEINKIFQDYQQERYPAVMESYNNIGQVGEVSTTSRIFEGP
ncbi:hypothetical protein BGZ95_010882 [Linnemannia exigua]|uniref:FAD-binding domain-containing protein n=1 Tax=Linnemannia exigua TaxID=604196 RepID=A0AAD4H6U5_9FUNG|nr:hypothetical protein BGZ95_010882 [Linnemannia exigua]